MGHGDEGHAIGTQGLYDGSTVQIPPWYCGERRIFFDTLPQLPRGTTFFWAVFPE